MNEAPPAAKRHALGTQLLRYGFVGVLSNAAGYLVYLVATHQGAEPKVAMSLLYLAGACIGFWGNRQLTFKHGGSVTKAGMRYVLAHCMGYLINLAILYVFVDRLSIPHQLAQAIGIVAVAGFLFVTFRHLVFGDAASKSRDHS
ncbi:GtrA family protein [Ramlibacter sp. WS9]|nr:GtrA family protein [Ramlibacter sp. WS9]